MKIRRGLDDKKFDVRVRDRLLAEGKISAKEVEDYYTQLEDDKVNFEWAQTPQDKRERE